MLMISGKVIDIMTKLAVMLYLAGLFSVIDGKFTFNK
jgi:hypothetical protein